MADSTQEVSKLFAPSAGNPVKYLLNPRATGRSIAGLVSPSERAVHLRAGGTAGQEAAASTRNAILAALLVIAQVVIAAGSVENPLRLSVAKKDFNLHCLKI